jgi:CubicO group peptidase (beta-lactamase class C family)
MLQAAAVPGLVGCFGSAFAQSRSKKSGKMKEAAQDELPVQADERVEQVLAPVRDEHHLPGVIGAIYAGNRLAAIGALGIRKIGSPQPIRVTDQVHLGSNTKAMTATLIGMLVDEGKLSWGSTIRDVFPEVASQLHPEFQTTTLAHLLTHRAGLPANTSWWRLPGRTTTEQRRSLLTTMMKDAPQSRPGSTYVYSNVGYTLAGLMAEEVTDQSWETLMRRRLFEPLGMASAGFGSPGQPGEVDQPWGHRPSGNRVEPTQQDNLPVMGPAGTVHCSIPDWAKFAALHLAGARGRPKLLKLSTFRALHTSPPGFDYAGGWLACQRTWAGGHALTHNGSNTTWYATIWLALAPNFAILVATNQGGKDAQSATDAAVVELIRARDFLTQQVRPRR